MPNPPNVPQAKDPFFGLRVLQPNEAPSQPPKRILNYKDGSELVYIPPGPFWMGDEELNKKHKDCPRHEVYLDSFYMSVWPVINKQYRRFMREAGHRAPDGDWWIDTRVWEGTRLLLGYEEHPVVCVCRGRKQRHMRSGRR